MTLKLTTSNRADRTHMTDAATTTGATATTAAATSDETAAAAAGGDQQPTAESADWLEAANNAATANLTGRRGRASDGRSNPARATNLTGLLASNRAAATVLATNDAVCTASMSECRDAMATLFNDELSARLTEEGFVTEKRGLFKRGGIEGESILVKNREHGVEQKFLHLELKKFKDRFTNYDELKGCERFVGMLDGTVTERQVKNDNPGWFDRNISPSAHGKTSVDADIYLTRAAMTNVGQATRDQALDAFARAEARLKGEDKLPGWANPDPVKRARAQELIEEYDPTATGNDSGNQNIESDYWRATGRNAWADSMSWDRAKRFAGFVDKNRSGDERGFLDGFEKLARDGEFYTTVGAINELNPREPVLLNHFEVTGPEVHIQASGPAGAIAANPNEAIEKIFKMRTSEVEEKHLVNHHPYTSDNQVELLVDGTRAFPEIFKAIDGAKKSINVSYYIFKDDALGNRMADALIAKARSGVEVNFMIDGIGAMQMPGMPQRHIIDRMEAGGVKVIRNHIIDPTRSAEILNHPDHRKLVIVDGTTAFTGGMNVANHYVDEYHDIMVKVEGSAVRQMQAEFLTSWMHLGGSIENRAHGAAAIREHFVPEAGQPAGEMKARVLQAIPGEHKQIMETYIEMIDSAKSSIKIENPYCTNPEIQDALLRAARREPKPDITVILPGESDHAFSHLAARARYREMIEAGIKIYEYPGFNHGKVMVVDDERVTVGSSNLDDVALRHIYELNLDVVDKSFAERVTQGIFDIDVQKSRLMKSEDISDSDEIKGRLFNTLHDVI